MLGCLFFALWSVTRNDVTQGQCVVWWSQWVVCRASLLGPGFGQAESAAAPRPACTRLVNVTALLLWAHCGVYLLVVITQLLNIGCCWCSWRRVCYVVCRVLSTVRSDWSVVIVVSWFITGRHRGRLLLLVVAMSWRTWLVFVADADALVTQLSLHSSYRIL